MFSLWSLHWLYVTGSVVRDDKHHPKMGSDGCGLSLCACCTYLLRPLTLCVCVFLPTIPRVVCLCVPAHAPSRCVSVSPCLWCVLLLHAVSTAFFVIVLTTNLQQDPIILQLPAPRALRGVPGKTTATPWWPRTSRAWPPPAGTPTTPRLTPTTPKQTPQRTPNSCHPLGNEASLFVMQ